MSVITYAKCKLLYHVGLMVTLFGGGVYFLTFYQSFNTVDIHLKMISLDLSLDARKPVFGVSDQVRHKPACTSSEKS